MFPTLRGAGSQLLFVTNAEVTLEILEVLRYKSLRFGNPAASELEISLCERKGQKVKDVIPKLNSHCSRMTMSLQCESFHFREIRRREHMNVKTPTKGTRK